MSSDRPREASVDPVDYDLELPGLPIHFMTVLIMSTRESEGQQTVEREL